MRMQGAVMGRVCLLLFAAGSLIRSAWAGVGDGYLNAYLEMFPTRATQAGYHAFDGKLEDFSTEKLTRWIEVNQNERELHEQKVLQRPQRDPLCWSEIIGNAAVFLLVRDDLPLSERQQRVRARALLLPAFARQCSATFVRAKGDQVAPELCKIAVGQLRAAAMFYREGFARAVGEKSGNSRPG